MQPTSEMLTVLDLVPFGQSDTNSRFFALRLSRPSWPAWNPGQFVMLRPVAFGSGMPLARPFCICHLTQRHLICFFKVVGKGTECMANLRKGDKILSWGPLGNSFAMDPDKPTLLLAGGMGIAPFVGYVYRHPQPWHISMLFGHREPLGCYPVDSINERAPVDSLREYEPGDLDNFVYSMQERIREYAEMNALILACGPRPFLITARNFAREFGARMQISLEKSMACGIGACLGCVVKTAEAWPRGAGKFVQSCTNGPVFWSDQIEL